MTTTKIVLMRGLPGSGKSTRALSEYSDYTRINRDSIRTMLFGEDYKFTRAREKQVKAVRNALIVDCVHRGINCVVDDTNLGDTSYTEIVAALEGRDSYSIVYDETCLDVPLDECIKRDAKRAKSVGREVIERMWRNHLQPEQPTHNSALPDCIIVDVDGTLAQMRGRHSFDWARVGEDEPVQHVIDIVNLLSEETTVVVMSGRDAICYEATASWLLEHDVTYDKLLMRPAGSNEKDSIIKRRLYEQNVRGKYNVKYVFDDRDTVVALWRSLGLPTFQVAYGAF